MPRPRRAVTARTAFAACLALTTTAACYHAVVETGRPVGATVVQKPWVNTFVFGLVAAPEIDVTRQCPGGVARVETQQSFVNSLVALVTLGIYTPQTATITCAAPRTTMVVPRAAAVIAVAEDAAPDARTAALRTAAGESARTGRPVYVTF